MKTSFCLPNRLFADAARRAADLGITRSELYRRAIEKYLAAERDRRLAEQVNHFLEAHGARADAEARAMWGYVQRVWDQALGADDW